MVEVLKRVRDDYRIACLTHNIAVGTGPGAEERLEADRRRWGYDSTVDFGAAGDAATVAGAVGRWAEAGVDTVVLQPTEDDAALGLQAPPPGESGVSGSR